jgi:hypothetical protein
MPHSTQEITAKISALPGSMLQEVFNFIEFMHAKAAYQAFSSKHEPALLSEQTLATDWSWAGEDFSDRIVIVSAQASSPSI